MKEKINGRLFALKYAFAKRLKDSLEEDKRKIRNGAEITFNDVFGIETNDCERNILDKNKVQALCNEYGIDIRTLEKTSKYTEVTIKNVPQKTINRVENIFNLLSGAKDNITATFADKMLEE